jgi:hypothetical protein
VLGRGGSLAVVLVALVGCKPHAGSSCDKGEARCVDPANALVCQAGHFVETPCRGKDGCRLQLEATACDIHGNRPGDPCSTDDDGSAVCSDGKTMLACHKGKYASIQCRGERGCVEENGHAECDESVAESGEACAHDGKRACSSDGKRVLACTSGQTETQYQCRGARGCSVVKGKIDCDVSVARNGDTCDTQFEGTFACTEDGLAIVKCNSGRFEPDETCKHGQRCLAEPGSTRCAKPDKT